MTGGMTGSDHWVATGLAIAWTVSAWQAGRIGFAASLASMRRRIRTSLLLIMGSALATAATAAAPAFASNGSPWSESLPLVSLLLVPLAVIAIRTVPRLRQADRLAAGEEAAKALDAPARRRVADPAVVVPVQVAALGAFLSASAERAAGDIPLWSTVPAAALLLAAATAALRIRQRTRRRRMGRIHWRTPGFASRAVRHSLVLLVAAAIAVVWLRSPEAVKLPEGPARTSVVSLGR